MKRKKQRITVVELLLVLSVVGVLLISIAPIARSPMLLLAKQGR